MCPPQRAFALAVAETIPVQVPSPSMRSPVPPQSEPSMEDAAASDESPALFRRLADAARRAFAELHSQRRRIEFLRFLDTVDASVPAVLVIHLILDECDALRAPTVQQWFADHLRFRTHFTPSPSSWMTQVERWFAILALRQFQEGTRRSTRRVEDAARRYLGADAHEHQPFVWSNRWDSGATRLE